MSADGSGPGRGGEPPRRKFKPKAPPARTAPAEAKSDTARQRPEAVDQGGRGGGRHGRGRGDRGRGRGDRGGFGDGRGRGRGRAPVVMGRAFFEAGGGGDAGPASEADISRVIARDERRQAEREAAAALNFPYAFTTSYARVPIDAAPGSILTATPLAPCDHALGAAANAHHAQRTAAVKAEAVAGGGDGGGGGAEEAKGGSTEPGGTAAMDDKSGGEWEDKLDKADDDFVDDDDDIGMTDLDGGAGRAATMKVLGNAFQPHDVLRPIVIPFSKNTAVRPEDLFARPHDAAALQAEEDEGIFFVQLPTALPRVFPESMEHPSQPTDGGGDGGGGGTHGAVGGTRAQGAKAAADTSGEADGSPGYDNSLTTMLPGRIGKLQIRRSGTVQLLLAGVALDVSAGMPCHFVEELTCVNPKQKTMSMFGQVTRRLVCAPNFEDLHEQRLAQQAPLGTRIKVEEQEAAAPATAAAHVNGGRARGSGGGGSAPPPLARPRPPPRAPLKQEVDVDMEQDE
ncbi:RNA polymerase III RPC4-domain-containing protein [Tribonema minus]|uniref:RNA polymerase III RPC4-domain-containing protein n=1 Tax=Tribonema minus TaxID=303371 RepID=A0A835ZEC9_9STRA|nr:RNA polymerase III RPC4-domain-containing protein [Tribonema minus]